MAVRLATALQDAGVDAGLPLEAHGRAMEWRQEAFPDDHHQDYLHPGRTLLILLEDMEVRTPRELAAGALFDSRRPELRVGLGGTESGSGLAEARSRREGGAPARDETPDGLAEVLRAVEEIPILPWRSPQGEADSIHLWLEAILASERWVTGVVLAEALDHLRHAHLWERWEEPSRAAVLARTHLLPLAERVGGTPARRYRWWVRRVGAKLEARGGGGG